MKPSRKKNSEHESFEQLSGHNNISNVASFVAKLKLLLEFFGVSRQPNTSTILSLKEYDK